MKIDNLTEHDVKLGHKKRQIEYCKLTQVGTEQIGCTVE